jgi:hypothetical protein
VKRVTFVGLALVASGCSPQSIPTSEPEVIISEVEVEVEVEVERVVEREIQVEVTPQSCLDALDLAAKIFDNAAEFAGVSDRAITAAFLMDETMMEKAAADMEFLADFAELTGPIYAEAATACKEAGR